MSNTTVESINSAAPQVDALLSELLVMIQGTKGFVLEQAPDIIQQIVMLEIVNNTIAIFVCLCLITAYGFFLAYANKCKKKNEKMFNLNSYDSGFLCFCLFVLNFIPSIVILFSISSLIKVLFAPKIYLIEYLSGLIG